MSIDRINLKTDLTPKNDPNPPYAPPAPTLHVALPLREQLQALYDDAAFTLDLLQPTAPDDPSLVRDLLARHCVRMVLGRLEALASWTDLDVKGTPDNVQP